MAAKPVRKRQQNLKLTLIWLRLCERRPVAHARISKQIDKHAQQQNVSSCSAYLVCGDGSPPFVIATARNADSRRHTAELVQDGSPDNQSTASPEKEASSCSIWFLADLIRVHHPQRDPNGWPKCVSLQTTDLGPMATRVSSLSEDTEMKAELTYTDRLLRFMSKLCVCLFCLGLQRAWGSKSPVGQ